MQRPLENGMRFLETGRDDLRDDVLRHVETVHRELRSRIPPDYVSYMRAVFTDGAALTALEQDGRVRALAVWRSYRTTYAGLRFYVDDLVTSESERGRGWGGRLIAYLEDKARAMDCDTFALDSGVQRALAHRFYFRAGLTIGAFAFAKPLTDRFR